LKINESPTKSDWWRSLEFKKRIKSAVRKQMQTGFAVSRERSDKPNLREGNQMDGGDRRVGGRKKSIV
jgi:hypothetical protein